MKITTSLSFRQPARVTLIMFVITLAVAWGNSPALAQERRPQRQYQPPAQPSADATSSSVIASPDEDYRIGPSDVVELQVVDMPELSRTFRVNADGTISLPFLGIIKAQLKTSQELAKLIADGLRGDYLIDPQVTITVKQINSRTFFVQGAVRRPGVYQIEGRPSLLELVTVAGGLSESYGATAFIIRKIKQPGKPMTADASSSEPNDGSASPVSKGQATAVSVTETANSEGAAKYELIKANINGLLRGNFDQNLTVEPGDIIHIPPTDVFFVAGEVNAPGAMPLKEGTTLRQAISLAQGTTFEAAASRGIIFREDPNTGKRQEINVDIKEIMNGNKEDMTILANDVIIVPNSRLKSVSGALLRAFGVNSARLPYRY